ncbi:MAG: AAA family ATPase, partial [Candidatus Spyradocola sp.]
MLPISLVVEAFGPYLLPQRVDFTRFADKFLIWGETGAGKTALLDAMTVALYGRASAEERGDMEALRCQLAAPEQDSRVEFTFSVRGRRFRFWRRLRPIRRRKSESGEKFRLECGALELLDGGAERNLMQSDKAREQERAAETIIGMGYAQFVQVMVLPQGKFERFLTADSSEKEKILKNIFRTDRFNDYQESLNRSFRAFDAQVREREQAMEAQLRVYDADTPQALRDQLAADGHTLDRLRQEHAAHEQAYAQANAQAAQAQQLEERFARQDAAQAALQTLAAREQQMSALEAAVSRAERARSVAQSDAECARLTRELAAAQQEAQRAQTALTDAEAARETAAQQLAAAQEQQKDAAALRAELTAAE